MLLLIILSILNSITALTLKCVLVRMLFSACITGINSYNGHNSLHCFCKGPKDCWLFFQGFCQSLQVNPGIVYQIRPLLLPSTSAPVHYSWIMMPFIADDTDGHCNEMDGVLVCILQNVLCHVWIMLLLQNPYFQIKVIAQMLVTGTVKEINYRSQRSWYQWCMNEWMNEWVNDCCICKNEKWDTHKTSFGH